MINAEQYEQLESFIASHSRHHLFKIESYSNKESITFHLTYTSVMQVERLFIKATNQHDELLGFQCCSAEEPGEAIDWISDFSSQYFRNHYIIQF
jgi:hypothetical protein